MPWAAARITPSPGRSRLGRESPPAKPSKNWRGRFRCPGVANCVSGAQQLCAPRNCGAMVSTRPGQDLNFITAVAELRRFGQAHSLVQQTRASSNPTVFGKRKLTTARRRLFRCVLASTPRGELLVRAHLTPSRCRIVAARPASSEHPWMTIGQLTSSRCHGRLRSGVI